MPWHDFPGTGHIHNKAPDVHGFHAKVLGLIDMLQAKHCLLPRNLLRFLPTQSQSLMKCICQAPAVIIPGSHSLFGCPPPAVAMHIICHHIHTEFCQVSYTMCSRGSKNVPRSHHHGHTPLPPWLITQYNAHHIIHISIFSKCCRKRKS